jgi:hypothetical protein
MTDSHTRQRANMSVPAGAAYTPSGSRTRAAGLADSQP